MNSIVSAQNEIDSLTNLLNLVQGTQRVDVLNQLASFESYASFEKADRLIKASIQLAQSLAYDDGLVKAWLIQATFNSRQNNQFETDSLIRKAIQLSDENDFAYGKAHALLTRGVWNIRRGKFDEALQDHIDGVKVAKLLGDADLLQTHTVNIGHIKSRMGDAEEAEKYFIEALEIARDNNLKQRVAQVLLALGVMKYQLGDLASSMDYYRRAIPLFLEVNELRSASIVLNNLGYGNYLLDQYDSANFYYDQALDYRIKVNDQLGISRVWLNKARIEFDEGRINQSEKLAHRALGIARSINHSKRQMEIQEFLAKLYESSGRAFLALQAFKVQFQIKDSLEKVANRDKVAELISKFELERKENELSEARDEILILGQREQLLKTRQLLLLMGIAGLILVFVSFGYYLKSRAKEIRGELVKKNEEIKFHADQLMLKNKLLEDFRDQLTALSNNRENLIDSRKIEDIIYHIHRPSENLSWEQFRLKFEESFPTFVPSLLDRYPTLSPSELDVCILVKLNLANKEIAYILKIGYDAVKKSIQRMYKKIGLDSPEDLRIMILKM